MWKLYNAVCTATSTFDKWHDIRCLRAVFTAKKTTWKSPIIAHNALVNGAWFGLMTVARYIALSLISRYHCLDPTNRYISGLHCIGSFIWHQKWLFYTMFLSVPPGYLENLLNNIEEDALRSAIQEVLVNRDRIALGHVLGKGELPSNL